MYGVAISASLAVLVVMFASVTLLPALLSYLGPRVDRLAAAAPRAGRQAAEGGGESPAARWSHAVQRRPWTGGDRRDGVPARAGGAGARHAPRLPGRRQRPAGTMTRQAYDLNTEGFGPGTNGPIVIAAELPDASATPRRSTPLRSGCAASAASRSSPTARSTRSGDAAMITVIPSTSPQDEGDRGPGPPPARRRRPRRARRLRHHGRRSAA